MAVVVRSCTSPVQSDFRDNVSRRLVSSSLSINPGAARYAVDLTKSLGLLHENLIWTNLGHLLAVVYSHERSADNPTLSDIQRYFFLRIFLEFDGAAFIYFAKRVEEDGRVPREGERWAEVAQGLFCDTYNEYLGLATDPQDRIRIRHLADRRRARPFDGNSGRHQCFLHLNTLERLGLITKMRGKDRVYTKVPSIDTSLSPTAKLLGIVPSALELERAVSGGSLYDVVSHIFRCVRREDLLPPQWFDSTVRRIYRQILSTGVNLCSLQTLTEALQIEALSLGHRPMHSHDLLNQIRLMQRETPREIRFHVDVFGRPAFLKIS